jgi:hypothetical protein
MADSATPASTNDFLALTSTSAKLADVQSAYSINDTVYRTVVVVVAVSVVVVVVDVVGMHESHVTWQVRSIDGSPQRTASSSQISGSGLPLHTGVVVVPVVVVVEIVVVVVAVAVVVLVAVAVVVVCEVVVTVAVVEVVTHELHFTGHAACVADKRQVSFETLLQADGSNTSLHCPGQVPQRIWHFARTKLPCTLSWSQ